MDEHWLSVLSRWLSGAILCFFGFIPAWVLIQVIITLLNEPSKFDLTALLVLLGAGALAYFFALLAYRAFTGRGRRQDGGLLPPWAMIGFIYAFGIMAVCIIIFGLFKNEWRPVIGGIAYLVLARGALLMQRKSRSDANHDA
jgi:hypothetical protein